MTDGWTGTPSGLRHNSTPRIHDVEFLGELMNEELEGIQMKTVVELLRRHFSWRDWGKRRNPSVRITGALVEIQTEHLQSTEWRAWPLCQPAHNLILSGFTRPSIIWLSLEIMLPHYSLEFCTRAAVLWSCLRVKGCYEMCQMVSWCTTYLKIADDRKTNS